MDQNEDNEREREVQPGSREWKENLEALRRLHSNLDKNIRGVEAIGERPPSLNWKRKERSAIAWAMKRLERHDRDDAHRIHGITIVAQDGSLCLENPSSEDLLAIARRLEAAAQFRAGIEHEERQAEKQLGLDGDVLL